MFRILVIDDDPCTRLLLQKTLQGQSYDVILADSGEDGIAKALKFYPALIICDWQMLGMDGLEVCRCVKSTPDLAHTFFILLTTRTTVQDRVTGLDAGADDFLCKPIEGIELHARVRSGLRLYQVFHALQKSAQELQLQKQLLDAQFAEAAEYVRSLLPEPMIGEVTIEARFLPSKQLGGDCFDYYWLDPDFLMIYLLDVSGHGLGAALPSVSVQNLLRSQSLPGANFYRPDIVLQALNEAFQMDNQNDQYFTIWYGIYNRPKRQLFYASAGHPPAILLSKVDGLAPQVKQLKTRGNPIGMFPNAKYVSDRCVVDESSTLYVFSDGIYEVNQPDGSMWGLDGFIKLLADSNTSTNSNLDYLLQKARVMNNSEYFEDDCSLLQVKFNSDC
ncbi:SpoIIE family protein phosphatase [Phormidesmis priestleyi]